MNKTYQAEEQPTSELAGLRQRVAELKTLATEQERLEEALQESQQVLRKVFESVTDGISATDFDGITRCQPKNK